ncbi:hypothetical protein LX32DRAFT_427651 [Colletotrichum zoysiae]|uniref:Uncharacterized protein n=1 Tax=Colletotrichum zoysiae TaxID=1216348 RepID=A0AAD9M0C0_9PEZI|nr:hypothetical protein LX32DRAFT_427651 [Colletotrichum zoysiae]
MGTVLGLVQSPHAQAADVASLVVARSNGVELDGLGADEADFAVVAGRVVSLSDGAGEHLVVWFGLWWWRCARGILLRCGSSITGASATSPSASAAGPRVTASSTTCSCSPATSTTVPSTPVGVRVARRLAVGHWGQLTLAQTVEPRAKRSVRPVDGTAGSRRAGCSVFYLLS